VRIGLIRIPNMSPSSVSAALQQLNQEIAFMNANTDAIVVDVTRNTGGSLTFTESIAQRLIPRPFQTVAFEIRATATWIANFDLTVMSAEQAGAPPQVIDNLRANLNEVIAAFNENRGRTAPISLNPTGSVSLNPVTFAYAKPMLLLTDEFSTSAAEMLAAIIQDNGRAPIFGFRTMGAGGSVVGFDATAYTEGFATITMSLANRGRTIQTPDYPAAPYIENIGVRPDILFDSMTRENLIGGGLLFTMAFTNAVVHHATSTH
jgi:C-terminal processing protease CtpA/Prc